MSARRLKAVCVGLAGGFFSGLSGVGGGAIMVPLMTGILKFSQYQAHGTSLAVIVFIALAAAARYWSLGGIDLALAALLAVGSIPGGYLGARLMNRVPAMQLRRLFALFLFAVSIRLIFF